MAKLTRNLLIVLRFPGALGALVRGCGLRMAVSHLRHDAFGVNPLTGLLWHCDNAVYMGHWLPDSSVIGGPPHWEVR